MSFTESKVTLLCSYEHATGIYAKPHEASQSVLQEVECTVLGKNYCVCVCVYCFH